MYATKLVQTPPMNTLDTVLVALTLVGATLILYKTFKPRKGDKGCGCGHIECKIPKPKVSPPSKDSK